MTDRIVLTGAGRRGPEGPAGPRGLAGSLSAEGIAARDQAVSSAAAALQSEQNAAAIVGLPSEAAAQTYNINNDAGVQDAIDAQMSSRFAKPPKLTLITPGDSISRQNLIEDTGNKIIGWNGAGFLTWLNAWLRQRVEIVAPRTAAVSGNTTAQILGRLGADVTPRSAGVCVVMAGTNDVAAGTSAATITANLQAIYETLRDSGSLVVACTILPRNRSDDSDTKRATLREVNAWIRSYCQTARGVVLADTHAALVDPGTGLALGGVNANSRWFADGLHPNIDGAHAVASVLYRVLDPILPKYEDLTSTNLDATNLISNGRFVNTFDGLKLGGAVGQYARIPDYVAIPRGTFSIAVWVALDDWTPATPQGLLAQYNTSGNQRSFHYRINSTGVPQFTIDRYGDNTVVVNATGGTPAPFADGATGCMVVTRDAAAGTVQHATSSVAATAPVADLAALSKSNLGAAVTNTGTWSAFDGSEFLTIGAREAGTVDNLKGRVYRVMMFDAAGATTLDANLTAYAGENTYPTAVSGEQVTILPSGKSLADNWSLSSGSGNVAAATKIPRTDITGEWQQVSVTANTTQGITTDLIPIPATGWSVGDIIEGEIEVEVDGDWVAGTGGAFALAPFLRVLCTGASSEILLDLRSPYFNASPGSLVPLIPAGYPAPFRSVLRTPAAAIPAGTTKVQLYPRMGIGAKGTARFDRARLRKVTSAT